MNERNDPNVVGDDELEAMYESAVTGDYEEPVDLYGGAWDAFDPVEQGYYDDDPSPYNGDYSEE